ncbi:hypothetical protein [Rhizobium sp. X9]|uniref:hypothetical protein n=1 Tax=Rhizobium sp. X9 TaxID=2815360 RepID=UPI001C0E4A93|nr:hypothetical protein [Rhizobium sp. X9]
MELHPNPIIYCVVDSEPVSFCDGDATNATLSFAVNLSLECPATGEVDAESEKLAKATFAHFLEVLQGLTFGVFDYKEFDAFPLKPNFVLETVFDSLVGDPEDLVSWLTQQDPNQGLATPQTRYWTSAVQWSPDIPQDATLAGASDRLRAVQSWNAPVGHAFRLTQIVRVDPRVVGSNFVILPFFEGDVGIRPEPKLKDRHNPDTVDEVIDVEYWPNGGFGLTICRTSVFYEGKFQPFKPSQVDPLLLDDDGYLLVTPDSDDVRRFLKRIEERSASLLVPHAALSSSESKTDYGALFSLNVVKEKDRQTVSSPVVEWLVSTCMIAMLDNIALGILKPVKGSASSAASDDMSEGEILGPLISIFIDKLNSQVVDEHVATALGLIASDARKITAAIRSVIVAGNVLLNRSGFDPKAVGRVLLHVFGKPSTTDPEGERLASALLNAFISKQPESIDEHLFGFAVENAASPLPVISDALSALVQRLGDETGAERAIIAFIEASVIDDVNPSFSVERLAAAIATQLLGSISVGGPELPDALESAFVQTWLAYRSLLDGPFNGAEAIRRAAGNVFMRLLVAFEQDMISVASRSEMLASAVAGSDYFVARVLGGTGTTCFEGLIPFLVIPPCPLPEISKATVRDHLRKAYGRSVAEPISPPPSARFVPDPAPEPLTVQIASTFDPDKTDLFGRRLNGIAVAIKRVDDRSSPWAHAHLADITWMKAVDGTQVIVPNVLHPMVPALTDGRSPMFIEYEGFPFADPAFAERLADNQAAARAPSTRPFYTQGPASFSSGNFEKLPCLAYGRKFRSFAFVTSNAGTLPYELQGSLPWMPSSDVEPPNKMRRGRVSYRRRTAIAQMGIVETGQTGRPASIGASLKGVHPLAADYPRAGIVCVKGMPGSLDLFREADGRGSIQLPPLGEPHSPELSWKLKEIDWTGKPSLLTIRMFDGPARTPNEKRSETVTVDKKLTGLDVIELSIRQTKVHEASGTKFTRFLEIGDGTRTLDRIPIKSPNSMAVWFRVELRTEDSAPAAMYFANMVGKKSETIAAPLLILAPDTSEWNSIAPRRVGAQISSPRVGFLDFERWMANSDLHEQAYGASGNKAVELFEQALTDAYMQRHLDPKLAEYLTRLPDPSVAAINVDFSVEDALTGKPKALTYFKELDHALLDFINGLKLPQKTQILTEKYKQGLSPHERRFVNDRVPWTPAELISIVFAPLDEAFKFDIDISAGTHSLDWTGKTIAVRAATGTVAKLSFEALVASEHFDDGEMHPSVFDRRMLEYATRSSSDFFAFPSSALRVEVMYNSADWIGMNKLAPKYVTAEPVGTSRRYNLVSTGEIDAAERNSWRLVGEIDVSTQLWRPTGRPIYHYVHPRDYLVQGLGLDVPALPIDLVLGGKALELFEQEAFFDRLDIDPEPITQVLAPLPAQTILQQHVWDPPSATYFRHRFKLRSRYAGALQLRKDREVQTWDPEEEGPFAWMLRVAMLADQSRIPITRPQLRALIPLTSAPHGEISQRPAPPVSAVLQERPFSKGGLADRIIGEVRTGIGYGFPSGGVVEIIDSRKEFGPSPELDYRPSNYDTTLGIALSVEGPMGLTFDDTDAAAPAFSNTMMLLRPRALLGNDPPLEEAFAGIAMRRYIDPHWSVTRVGSPNETDELVLAADRSWWVDLGQAGGLQYRIASQGAQSLLTITASERLITITANKSAIDGVARSDNEVVVAKVDPRRTGALSLLHQTFAPGRFSLSVLVKPTQSKTTRGESNLPETLCSFEWSPRGSSGDKELSEPILLIVGNAGESGAVAYETTSSSETSLSWMRMGRDFGFTTVARSVPGDHAETELIIEPHNVKHLTAARESNSVTSLALESISDAAWLAPSTLRSPYPLHVHRHLALIATRYRAELGSPAEMFWATAMRTAESGWRMVDLSGDSIDLTNATSPNVRIVEFETPATILCAKEVIAPAAYLKSYVDLLATGYRANSELRMSLRFVGNNKHLRGFTQLSLLLSQPDPSQSAKPLELSVTISNTDMKFAVMLEVILNPVASANNRASGWVIYSDGSREAVAFKWDAGRAFDLSAIGGRKPGFFVEMTAKGSGEFWADFSVLHGQPTAGAGFDFNWLFSKTSEGGDPSELVSSRVLNRMVEAQARIVSVSPQIKVRA